MFCGELLRKETRTKDHVPPKSLFPKGLNLPLITVPSFRRCNGKEAKDVEYFRLVIGFAWETFTHPEARDLTQKALGSVGRDEAGGFRRSIAENLRVCYVANDKGFVQPTLACLLDEQRINNVVEKIVQGLVWEKTKMRLPRDYEISVFPSFYNRFFSPLERQLLLRLKSRKPETIGNDIFEYWREFRFPMKACDSLWLIRFYRGIYFLCFVMPREETIGSFRCPKWALKRLQVSLIQSNKSLNPSVIRAPWEAGPWPDDDKKESI